MEKKKTKFEKLFEYFINKGKNNFGNNLIKNSTYLPTHKNFPELENISYHLFKLKIKKNSLSKNKKIHKGVIATLVDKYTSFILHLTDKKNRGSVSVDLNLNYIEDCFLNEEIFFLCSIDKINEKMGFCSCIVFNENKNILCRAYHTKYFVKGKYVLPKL